MSRQTALRALLVCVLTVLGVVLVGGPAVAGSLIRDPFPTFSTFINSGSITVPGSYVVAPLGRSEPWVVQALVGAGECARFDVTSPVMTFGGSNDLEITVIAPNGTVFRNDDRGAFFPGFFANPLVQIGGAPNTGYYTVSISHFAGGGATTDFTLVYGRFTPAGNFNCTQGPGPTIGVDADNSGKEE